MDSAHWDIRATAKGKPTREQINVMLQSLLEEKFMLKVHRETRELPVYDLIAAEGGVKVHQLQESNCVEPNNAGAPSRPSCRGSG